MKKINEETFERIEGVLDDIELAIKKSYICGNYSELFLEVNKAMKFLGLMKSNVDIVNVIISEEVLI